MSIDRVKSRVILGAEKGKRVISVWSKRYRSALTEKTVENGAGIVETVRNGRVHNSKV